MKFVVLVLSFVYLLAPTKLSAQSTKWYVWETPSPSKAKELIAKKEYYYVDFRGDFRRIICADSIAKDFQFRRIPYPDNGCSPNPKSVINSIKGFNELMLPVLDSLNGKDWKDRYEKQVKSCMFSFCNIGDSLDKYILLQQFEFGVLFEENDFRLVEQTKCILALLIKELNEYPKSTLELTGFSSPNEERLLPNLALLRVQTVRAFFIENGISGSRLSFDVKKNDPKEYPYNHCDNTKFERRLRKVTWVTSSN